MPHANEPVIFSSIPTTVGPAEPPRLPKELISPMLVAAAVEVRNRLGKAQTRSSHAFL